MNRTSNTTDPGNPPSSSLWRMFCRCETMDEARQTLTKLFDSRKIADGYVNKKAEVFIKRQ